MSKIALISKFLLPVSEILEPGSAESPKKFIINDKDLALSETFTPKTSDGDDMYPFDNDGSSRDSQKSLSNSLLSSKTSLNFSQGPENLRPVPTLEKYKSLSCMDFTDKPYSLSLASSSEIKKLNTMPSISNDKETKRKSMSMRCKAMSTRALQNTEETTLDRAMCYNHISPIFSQEGINPLYFSYVNNNKTIVHHSNTRFSTAVATFPLPQYGRHKFSVLVEETKKTYPMLYIGVVSGNLKNRGLGYRPGWYFISTFSHEAYLNGLKHIEQSTFAKKGQVISVLVDMNRGWISFEVEGKMVIEGKINFTVGNNREFYPCVSLGEQEGRVCFV